MDNRRTFLKQLSIGTASIAIFKVPFAKSEKLTYTHVHIKESNFTLNAYSPSVIGFLYTEHPKKVEDEINRIRIKNHYRGRLTFRSTDKYKFDFAKDLIDYFFNEPSLFFYARVINTSDDSENNTNYVHDVVYRINYKKAISDLQKNIKNYGFYLDFITYLGRKSNMKDLQRDKVPYVNFKTDRKHLVNYLNTHIPDINLQIERHNYNNLSQLCDFFTGNIYGDTIGVENKTKKVLLKYLKEKLQVKKLGDLYNSSQHRRFIIWSIPK